MVAAKLVACPEPIAGWPGHGTCRGREATNGTPLVPAVPRHEDGVWATPRLCRRRHRKKSRKWIKTRYFRHDDHRHWVFTGILTDQKGQGGPIQLMSAAQVKILRYVKIRGAVNPYDPEWELYLEARLGWQRAQTRAGRSRIESLWKGQEGRCVVCGQPLRIAEEGCHVHHRIGRSRGGPDTTDNLELPHANCHRQIHVQEPRTKAAALREGRS
jgi:RNA-directed DNA polymerase